MINRLFILQKKASRLIHFKECNAHTDSLIFKSKMVNLPDKIETENCLFISKYVKNKLSPIFKSLFIFSSLFSQLCNFICKQRSSKDSFLLSLQQRMINELLLVWPQKHGIIYIQSQIKDPMINTFSPNKLKIFSFNFYFNLYQT